VFATVLYGFIAITLSGVVCIHDYFLKEQIVMFLITGSC
jgi:hypothetical protein